ncbi:MAG: adenosylcobinamide-GDP ribazoletransferase [Oscillospiraceae bacterium]|nr:adenosylcobinamide-GDP ribazoletransferase [Oscillospiraceae bacterium]
MSVLKSVLIAFSTFSAIPVPHTEWEERSMRISLCFFPLVGAVVALCCWCWGLLCSRLGFPNVLRGAGMCLLPIWLTGGIHLDGYADTCDALASHADREKLQEILKDPHLGAFAVIRLGTYMIADFALWCSLTEADLPALLGIFCLSRSLSGLSLNLFPLRPGSGLARSFAEAADRRAVCTVLTLTAVLSLAALWVSHAFLSAVMALLLFLYLRNMSVKKFGGLSGDLAGWFLQTAEIWMLGMLMLSRSLGV